ncbi:ras association domain-containing protein 9 [Arapaima gigas]
MAPFRRIFLKARLKSRSECKDSLCGKEIQVWLCQEEKVVCGLTKCTTCSDVVQALLDDHRNLPEHEQVLCGEARDYCLLERWKGFERTLPPLTRVLRLWEAWGEEKPFVQFVLVRATECPPQCSKKASRCSGKLLEKEPAEYIKSLPVDQQKRMVKKAFRKLEKIKKQKMTRRADGIDKMVRLIITQDHLIQQQICRIRELDLQIECIERNLQTGSDGLDWNTVSLMDMGQGSGIQQERFQLQEFFYTSNGIDQLEAQVKEHRVLIGELSSDIDTELLRILSGTEEPQGGAAAASVELRGPQYAPQLEDIRKDLEWSVRQGVSLLAQAAQIEEDMKLSEAQLHFRREECKRLVALLSTLHVRDGKESTKAEVSRSQVRCPSVPAKLSLIPSPSDITDTDSDTGISSTHSQDSLIPSNKSPPLLDSDI